MKLTRYLNKNNDGKFGIYRLSNSTVVGFSNGERTVGVSISEGTNICDFYFGYNKHSWSNADEELNEIKLDRNKGFMSDARFYVNNKHKSIALLTKIIHEQERLLGVRPEFQQPNLDKYNFKLIIIKKDHIIEYQFNEFNTKCHSASTEVPVDDSNKFLGVKIERNYLDNWITKKGRTFRSTELIISRDNKSNTFKEIGKEKILFKP